MQNKGKAKDEDWRMSQLPLSLSLKDEATFENFYAARNTEIIVELKNLLNQGNAGVIYICGQRGQGCSHLLQASCHYAHQLQQASAYLPLGELINYTPAVLDGFETTNLVCLDDIEQIAGKADWEEAVFHLFNRIYDRGGKIIIAANDLPSNIPVGLADLSSRLAWGIVYSLHSLSDEEKLAVFIMRAERRGMQLPEEVARFILTHCPRHMSTLLATLDVLDRASLAAKRRLTVPFVKEVLEI